MCSRWMISSGASRHMTSIASWSPRKSEPLTVSKAWDSQESSGLMAPLMPPAAATEWERTGWTLEMMPTVAPASAAAVAARWPARPAPMIRTSCAGMARFWQVEVVGTVPRVPDASGPVSGNERGHERPGAAGGEKGGNRGRDGRDDAPAEDLVHGEGATDDEALLRLGERPRVRVIDVPLPVADLRRQVALGLRDLAAGPPRPAHVRQGPAPAAVGVVGPDPPVVRKAVEAE